MRLTDKQRAFVTEYVKDFNATQAALRAGYSDRTARSIGCENLTKPNIVEAIDNYFADKVMSANEVLYHLTEIARGDIGQMITRYGEPDLDSAEELGKTSLIQSIKTKTVVSSKDDSETHYTEFKLYDRLRALDLLARFHDLTNKTRVQDWKSEAIELIREGKIDYHALKEVAVEFGEPESLADQLFKLAGVNVTTDAPTSED